MESDPGLLSFLLEQLKQTVETSNEMDIKLDAKLDTKFGGLERRMDQMLESTRVDWTNTMLSWPREDNLLEDVRSEIGSLRSNCSSSGSTGSSSPGRKVSPSVYDWQPQNVAVRGWAPFGSRPSAKIDRIEFQKLSEEVVKLLPDCLRKPGRASRF